MKTNTMKMMFMMRHIARNDARAQKGMIDMKSTGLKTANYKTRYATRTKMSPASLSLMLQLPLSVL